jgi:predicted phosphodiesterase
MKLHILSDLHLSQAGMAHPVTDADAVILAGDIARPREAVEWAGGFGKPVLYVPGNHEYFGGSLAGTRVQLEQLCSGTGIHLLDDRAQVLQGVRFLGCTLWSDFLLYGEGPEREAALAQALQYLRDFQRIRLTDDAPDLFTPAASAARFRRHADWLAAQLAQPHDGPTVVITHHAPSTGSIAPRFAGSPLNLAFISRAEHLMGGDRVQLWVHGHTHDSFDYQVNGTRVVCNPRGYQREGVNVNASFDPQLVIDLVH